jgi:PHP family Zn ribbon phosphoesterase
VITVDTWGRFGAARQYRARCSDCGDRFRTVLPSEAREWSDTHSCHPAGRGDQ